MARNIDVFGFDELEKAFKNCAKRYPNEADRLLMTYGKAAQRKVKQDVPVYSGAPKAGIKPGQLKKSYRLQRVKLYKGGTIRVVRVKSDAPHAHLIEYGHEIVTRTRTRSANGRFAKEKLRMGKASRLSGSEKKLFGARSGGRTRAFHTLEYAILETRDRFEHDAEKLLEKICKDLEL